MIWGRNKQNNGSYLGWFREDVPTTHGNRLPRVRVTTEEWFDDDTPPYPPDFRPNDDVYEDDDLYDDYSGSERRPIVYTNDMVGNRVVGTFVVLTVLTAAVGGGLLLARSAGLLSSDGTELEGDGVDFVLGRSDAYDAQGHLLAANMVCVQSDVGTDTTLTTELAARLHVTVPSIESGLTQFIAAKADISVEQVSLYGAVDNGIIVACSEATTTG